MIIELAVFAQLASSCAPRVALDTLAAVARTESRFDALAIYDNTARRSFKVGTREQAIALATELVVVDQHSVDLGIMQINSGNLPRLGLSVTDAFDPCRSLAAADRILVEGYAAPLPGGDQQEALHHALSRYNTGNPERGLINGYVQRVQASAEVIVPALRLRNQTDATDAPGPLGGSVVLAQPLPPPVPSWDVYGQAKASHGQSTVSGAGRPAAPHPPAPPMLPGAPIQLQATLNKQAVTDAR